jgi:hypothetical protein
MPPADGFLRQLAARIAGRIEQGWTVMRCTPTLDVVAEGVMRSPGIILTEPFDACLRDLRKCYDIIVIDGPVLSEAPECRALDALSDALILVCSTTGTEPARARGSFGKKRFSAMIQAV